jgi:hypothetical protein
MLSDTHIRLQLIIVRYNKDKSSKDERVVQLFI